MKSFWIVNISDRLISLGDLGILLQPRQSVNLLDSKHYFFTEKQINDSLTSGSLYKRSDKIKVRKVAPNLTNLKGPSKIEVDQNIYPSKVRSLLEHKEYNYDEENEIQMSDEQYAEENAELAEEDDLGRYKK